MPTPKYRKALSSVTRTPPRLRRETGLAPRTAPAQGAGRRNGPPASARAPRAVPEAAPRENLSSSCRRLPGLPGEPALSRAAEIDPAPDPVHLPAGQGTGQAGRPERAVRADGLGLLGLGPAPGKRGRFGEPQRRVGLARSARGLRKLLPRGPDPGRHYRPDRRLRSLARGPGLPPPVGPTIGLALTVPARTLNRYGHLVLLSGASAPCVMTTIRNRAEAASSRTSARTSASTRPSRAACSHLARQKPSDPPRSRHGANAAAPHPRHGGASTPGRGGSSTAMGSASATTAVPPLARGRARRRFRPRTAPIPSGWPARPRVALRATGNSARARSPHNCRRNRTHLHRHWDSRFRDEPRIPSHTRHGVLPNPAARC